jgi:hypothetical protein
VRPVDLVVIQVTHENERVAAFPDPHSLARDELTSLLKELTSREEAISEERRTLHAQIGVLRRELVERLRDEGDTVICGADFLDPGSAGVREPLIRALRRVRTASPWPSHPTPTSSQTRHHVVSPQLARKRRARSGSVPKTVRTRLLFHAQGDNA